MIKAILFDLDGVLVDADEWHFDALNLAFRDHEMREISWQEHLAIYKGLPTAEKLRIYSTRNGVATPRTLGHQKRFWTDQFIRFKCRPDPEKVDMLERLHEQGYRIAVCSNAIRSSVESMVELAGLSPFVELILSNEDVERPKPDPMIYEQAMRLLDCAPEESLIVEDSGVGRNAATASGAHVCFVAGPEEVNVYRVLASLAEANRVNVVIPAAGQGKRFTEAGFFYPKPLIPFEGRTMLHAVIDNLTGVGEPLVLLQRDHIARYALDATFPYRIAPVDGLTEGAACTVLLARDEIDNQNELMLANSDQLVRPASQLREFLDAMRALGADGGILTFQADDPKWSYASVDHTLNNDRVIEVAEKRVLPGNHATVGIYYFRRGSDFVRCAERMIAKDTRTNGEFYVCPVFNELILMGRAVYTYEIPAECMVGLGTPEDLERALEPVG